MRTPSITTVFLTTTTIITATTALRLPLFHSTSVEPYPAQLPMQAPGIQLPPTPNDDNPSPPNANVILSDVIGSTRTTNIFAGFTRSVAAIAERLDSAAQNTTVLAPRNAAIQALPRKPWENPAEYATLGTEAYEGQGGEDRAQANLRRFTEAHIVPVSPWKEGERVKTLGGGEVWWESVEGRAYVHPGKVEVQGVVSRVANGQVWVLDGVLNYAA